MQSIMSKTLANGTLDSIIEILSFGMKYIGRNEELVNIKEADVSEIKEMCASGRSINVNFQVNLPGKFIRHVSICFFESEKFGGKTTEKERFSLIMGLRELDLSQFTLQVVGASSFGPTGRQFVVLICHMGNNQEWFIETRNRGDKEWKGNYPLCHISTCWGWNGENLALRGNDKFTPEHAWTLSMIYQVGNFIPDTEDTILLDKFKQRINISDEEEEEEVSA